MNAVSSHVFPKLAPHVMDEVYRIESVGRCFTSHEDHTVIGNRLGSFEMNGTRGRAGPTKGPLGEGGYYFFSADVLMPFRLSETGEKCHAWQQPFEGSASDRYHTCAQEYLGVRHFYNLHDARIRYKRLDEDLGMMFMRLLEDSQTALQNVSFLSKSGERKVAPAGCFRFAPIRVDIIPGFEYLPYFPE